MTHAQVLQKKETYTPLGMLNHSNGTQALCDTTITFFDVFSSSVGYGGAISWRAAIFVDAVEFQLYSGIPMIDAVQFQIEDLSVLNSVTLEIYEGSAVSNYTNSAALTNGTLIYSQDVTADVVQNTFGVHALPAPISINKTLGYTIALVLDQNAAGFPMAVDNGPIIPAKGGWISAAGNPFVSLASTSNANWGIKLCMDGTIIDPDYDVRLDDALFTPTGYEITPVDQLNPSGYNFWVDAENIGNFTADITTKVDVNSGSFVDSTTVTSVAINTIGRGNLPTPYVIPSMAGTYNVEASASVDSTDYNPLDNTKNGSFIISDTDSLIYSRTSSSNFFTNSGRFNGNVYEVNSTETWIKSVKAEYFNPATPILTNGMDLIAQIWQVTSSNTIGTLLYTSETITLSGITSSTRYNFDFTFDTSAILLQGKYLVAVSNPGCLLMNSDINYYQPNTAFINSNPLHPNWVETANQYYRVDLLLSDCSNFVQFDNVDSNYCLTNSPVQLSAIPSGGTYSGPGVSGSTFDPSVAGLGNHTIIYNFTSAGGCSASDTMIITVSSKPLISISGLDTSYCIYDSAATLSATPSGGTFNGTGIIGNEFRPDLAGAGTHMITYTYNTNGCGGTDTAMITVNTPPNATISGLDSIYCVNSPDVTFTTLPAGGVINGTGGLNGNVFSPANAGVGMHVVHYSVTTNGCTGVDSVIIRITPPTSIDFSTQTIGTSVSFTNISSSDTYGFQWDFGDGDKSNDKNPTHIYTSFGTYNVCLTAIGCAGVEQYCTDVFVVDSSSLSINELLDKAISVYPNPTNGDLNIEITASGEHTLSYHLLDITGRSILTNDTNLEGNKRLILDLNSIENGIYFLQLNVEGNRITKKIVVEK